MAGILLQQVRIVDPVAQTDQIGDALMVDGIWRAIAPHLDPAPTLTVIDGRGKVLLPGLVDLYSHSSEPGYEARERLAELMAGAIGGGFTRLGILPDTLPALDQPSTIRYLLDRACALPTQPQPYLLPWAALTRHGQGESMTELAELAELRQLALAGLADGRPLNQPVLLRRLLEYTQPFHCPIALWPCDIALRGDGIARDGSLALAGGLPGCPIATETTALTTILELVQELGTAVHIMRVSTARSVALIAQAKAAGLPITASTTWMHLLFSTQDVLSYDPNLRMEPPLGNPPDQAALIDGVKTGVIDAIAIDHSPYTYEEKTVAFQDAPPGAIGLALALSALWQQFVSPGTWTPLELLAAISLRPSHCLGLQPSQIAVGQPVEAVLFDPEEVWTVDRSTLHTAAVNTPFLHQTLRGKVCQTWMMARSLPPQSPVAAALTAP